MQWLMANWQTLLLALLAIDAALIPLFPKVQILVSIKNALSGIAEKK